MARPLVLLTAVAWATAPLSAQEVDSILERSSKVPFPVEMEVAGGTAHHVLTGTGIRTKTFLKVKVYAFGLYVDPAGARSVLSSFAGRSASELEHDDAFYQRILDRNFGTTLRLVMTRDVGGEDMADAFDGALRPRVQHAAAEMGMPDGEEALDIFRGFFSLGEMTKGAELVFTCSPEGVLWTTIKGEPQPQIESPGLCWALFDVYLGEHPISGDGKKRLVERFPEILAGG